MGKNARDRKQRKEESRLHGIRPEQIQSSIKEAEEVLEHWEKIDATIAQGKMPKREMDETRAGFVRDVPGEMAKGIAKYKLMGKAVTVDSLLEEAKTTPGFMSACSRIGLDLAWFEAQATKAIKEYDDKEANRLDARSRNDVGVVTVRQPISVVGKVSRFLGLGKS